MKKFLAAILVCVMFVTTVSVTAFADNEAVTDNSPLGAICDADGNVIEYIMMPRTRYVDAVYTLPADGGYITTYQYEPDVFFSIGFRLHNRKEFVTTRDRTLRMEIFKADSIGADYRRLVARETYVTNIELNEPVVGSDDSGYSIFLDSGMLDPAVFYYNGKFTNLSDLPLTVNILVESV